MVELIRSDAIRSEEEPTYTERRGMFMQALARLTAMYTSRNPQHIPTAMKVEIVKRAGESTGETFHTLIIYGIYEQT